MSLNTVKCSVYCTIGILKKKKNNKERIPQKLSTFKFKSLVNGSANIKRNNLKEFYINISLSIINAFSCGPREYFNAYENSPKYPNSKISS